MIKRTDSSKNGIKIKMLFLIIAYYKLSKIK